MNRLSKANGCNKPSARSVLGLTESESTRFLRDANGRWQATETRNQEVRTSGGEQVAEETVRRLSDNGTLTMSEKKVTRQTKSNGQDETVTESYLQLAPGVVASGDRLQLSERIRLTTTTTADRAQQTVREVEARNPAAPNQPLRVVERTVETYPADQSGSLGSAASGICVGWK